MVAQFLVEVAGAVAGDPFILSGGAAYCMTLRLDRASRPRTARTVAA